MTAPTVVRFERALRSIEGIYYRLDKGISGGRNSASTEAALRMRVDEIRALLAAELYAEDAPLYDYLDEKPKVADRWNRVERRFFGCRV